MVVQKFESQRVFKKLNRLAWRVRIQLSSIINRLRTLDEGGLGTHRQDEQPETCTHVVADVAPAVDASRGPIHYLENEPTSTNVPKPNSLLVSEHDAPEEEIFALFAHLPPEIRMIIWQFASSEARVIEVAWINRTAGFRLRSLPRLPAAMRVCRESRTEALKLYKPYFRRKDMPRLSILINPASDIFFFQRVQQTQEWHSKNSLWRHELGHVRRVAVLQRGFNSLGWARKMASLFPNLDEVVVLWGTDPSMRPPGTRLLTNVEKTAFNLHASAWRWRSDLVAMSAAQGWWAEIGREPPAITVRRWHDGGVSEF